MPRFFISPENIRNNHFVLEGSEAHHAAHVLRKKTGDRIDLFDGRDLFYQGIIETVADDRVEGTLTPTTQGCPIPIQITLYQALIKAPKWDWLLEKACEIGVAQIVPLITSRSVVRVNAASATGKMARWSRIALEASKQCGRSDIMVVTGPALFPTALSNLPSGSLSLIPWEKEMEKSIRQASKDFRGKAAALFVGPEGGWESQEIELAIRRGLIPVRLGPTLLRSETAGLVAATLLLSELGVY